MRVSVCSHAVLLVSLCCMAAGLAEGQQSEHFNVPGSAGPTVSVATLRVPEKAWRHFAKAKEAAGHNRMAESDRETLKALEIAPEFAAAYLLRADTKVQEHSFAEAIVNACAARRLEPDMMWSGVVLAGAYNGLRRYTDARLVLQGLHGAEAESWQASYEAARAAAGLNDVEGALRWSAAALKDAPETFVDTHLVRTNAFVLAHRWSDAETQMEAYLHSKGAQEHRAEVLVALENVKRQARAEGSGQSGGLLASRF